jgi:antitoxin (DNA-binding transcriptional repressor) of toxin-antitoxin stability system
MSVLAYVTRYGHNVTMRQIKIADLKARLSEHLRAVRGGETIAVLDRDTPVAHIVPIRAKHTLRVRKPTAASPPIHKVTLPGPAGLDLDIVRLLLEERQSQR